MNMKNPLSDHLTAARSIVSAYRYIPVDVLEAAAEAVEQATFDTLLDLQRHPGRRGNPARRQAAADDSSHVRAVRRDLTYRAAVMLESCLEQCWSEIEWLRVREVERAPALGVAQWTIVAQLSSGWSTGPSMLYEAAQVIIPDDTPLDLDHRRLERLRRDASNAVGHAERQLKSLRRQERLHRNEAQASLLRAEDAAGEATTWAAEVSVRKRVLRLGEDELSVYAAHIVDGMHPSGALAAAERAFAETS